jgi:peptide/nickel transport system substrate-binding protein
MRRTDLPGRLARSAPGRGAAALAALVALAACGGPSSSGSSTSASGSGGTLVIGMTATNLPGTDTDFAQTEGGEGIRFVGMQLYDGLTKWDLTHSDRSPALVPGLATSWTPNADGSAWTFKLRPNVRFSDGSPWNADAAIFNFDRYASKSSPYYYPELNSEAGLLLTGITGTKKIDDMTIEIDTDGPLSYLPDDLAVLPMGSELSIKRLGNDGFAKHPSGTGPFTFQSMVSGQQLVMVRNPSYWSGAPKLDKVILRTMPDAAARVAAMRSNAVNWIEVPVPDEVPALRSAGYQVLTNSYSHVWPWVFDVSKKPWNDVRVRQAANYAINREAMAKDLLKGTGAPAYQFAPRGDVGYDPKLDTYRYDPAKARTLLAQAGYPNGFDTTLSFPTSGSGNMIPIPMNEALQQDLAKVGIKVKLQPVEWSSMLTDFFSGRIPGGADAINISLGYVFISLWNSWFGSASLSNAGKFADPQVDTLLGQAKATLDTTKRDAVFTQINAQLIQDAPWLIVVNDLNPRVLAPSVHGFHMPRSWFIDLTTAWVG